ncbi:hypothetical protein Goklo_021352 [Gossypium klotzschianum]|uniref:Uncharacterized protein n=1 Tax=Gossypium klotzschianum TaxID=34286 RepID=A0A7J8UV88_9ROSI|nr:hypothetical protein [Gossypium klotzschianum]
MYSLEPNSRAFMENRFIDKVKDNVAILIWSEKTQQEKGDSIMEGYMSELWDLTRISVTQNNLQERVHNSAPLPNDPSRQSLFLSRQHLDFLEEANEHNGNDLWDLILTHPYMKKRFDVFALSIYKLVIFPKVLRHIDEAVSALFDRLDKRVTLVLTILAETFRSLNACRI